MQLCGSLSILWHCLSLGLEWKLTFSRPVATAEFSKFAGILSAALSQHHLSGFGIVQLEFHHLHQLCSKWFFLRPTWLHILGCLALGEWSHSHGYPGHEDLFLNSFSVYSCHFFLISPASVRSIPFLSFIEPGRFSNLQKPERRTLTITVRWFWNTRVAQLYPLSALRTAVHLRTA